jgi:hypothetical protein
MPQTLEKKNLPKESAIEGLTAGDQGDTLLSQEMLERHLCPQAMHEKGYKNPIPTLTTCTKKAIKTQSLP